MNRSHARALLSALVVFSLAVKMAPPADACRILIRHPDPERPRHLPALVSLQHKELHEEVTVRDQVALYSLRAVFHNPHSAVVEGTYYLELDPGAEVSRFTMMVNGKEVVAEILDAAKARRIYQNIVNQMRDPALLEYVGSRLLQARIFPIPANGDVTVNVQYTQSVEVASGVLRINALDAVSRSVEEAIPSVSFKATIESSVPIKSVFSPTHNVDVVRTSDKLVKASFEKTNYQPRSWLNLYCTLADDDVGLHALIGKDDGGRKYFMMTCSPKVAWEEKDRIPKDVVFVLDTSGSMAGEKMTQARNALLYCVNRLNPDDRFNIVDFSTEARACGDALMKVSEDARKTARAYIEKLEARGGTAIAEALERALKMFGADPGRVSILVFLTDGIPTIGEREPDAVLKSVREWNRGNVRAFAFGVGNDVNTRLLDRLSADNGGARDYVAPGEDIEIKVSAFYDKVSAPILTDIAVSAEGVRLFDLYPRKLPDLFRGSQLVLFGRCEGEGKAEVTLTGQVRGERRSHKATIDFANTALRHDLVPRLWATRKVAYLLEDIRLRGAQKEVIDEVVALARQYGIVTPYTSYLITEDSPVSTAGHPPGAPPMFRGGAREKELKSVRTAAKSEEVGESAVRMSQMMDMLSGGPAAAPAPSAEAFDVAGAEVARNMGIDGKTFRQRIRHMGSKTFYSSGGAWYDSLFKEGDEKDAKVVRFMSEEYEKLLREKPEIAKYLAVGEDVFVVHESVLYHVVKE